MDRLIDCAIDVFVPFFIGAVLLGIVAVCAIAPFGVRHENRVKAACLAKGYPEWRIEGALALGKGWCIRRDEFGKQDVVYSGVE